MYPAYQLASYATSTIDRPEASSVGFQPVGFTRHDGIIVPWLCEATASKKSAQIALGRPRPARSSGPHPGQNIRMRTWEVLRCKRSFSLRKAPTKVVTSLLLVQTAETGARLQKACCETLRNSAARLRQQDSHVRSPFEKSTSGRWPNSWVPLAAIASHPGLAEQHGGASEVSLQASCILWSIDGLWYEVCRAS